MSQARRFPRELAQERPREESWTDYLGAAHVPVLDSLVYWIDGQRHEIGPPAHVEVTRQFGLMTIEVVDGADIRHFVEQPDGTWQTDTWQAPNFQRVDALQLRTSPPILHDITAVVAARQYQLEQRSFRAPAPADPTGEQDSAPSIQAQIDALPPLAPLTPRDLTCDAPAARNESIETPVRTPPVGDEATRIADAMRQVAAAMGLQVTQVAAALAGISDAAATAAQAVTLLQQVNANIRRDERYLMNADATMLTDWRHDVDGSVARGADGQIYRVEMADRATLTYYPVDRRPVAAYGYDMAREAPYLSAHGRALELFRRHLTDEQRAQFEATGTFEVIGSAGGYYTLNTRVSSYHLTRQDPPARMARGRRTQVERTVTHHYCVMLADDRCPSPDIWLAQKLLVETDEPRMKQIANHYTTNGDQVVCSTRYFLGDPCARITDQTLRAARER